MSITVASPEGFECRKHLYLTDYSLFAASFYSCSIIYLKKGEFSATKILWCKIDV